MQMDAECVPCLLGRVLYETRLCAPDRKEEVMVECLKTLCEKFRIGANSADVATHVHRRAYDLLCPDPYKDLKRKSNLTALSMFERARSYVYSANDKLKAACLCSIAGNVLDFGIRASVEGPELFSNAFDSIVAQGLDVDDTPRMKRILEGADSVVYLFDNCGEIVFDKLLIEQIKSFGAKVIGVVKGEPILTDATREDAVETSVASLVDDLDTTGMFAIGINVLRMSAELRNKFEKADLIVSKGMANFEALSDYAFKPIAYILRAKCRPVARAIGARINDNVVRVVE
ncbi:MAG: ARMT1-like domain-containing protein [Methanomassiliicoccales archaeon]|jgi:uncharacterized protein with ATP-grasp and redox domains|nr:ARMT1-like domain-containing protein [Methanomassiliicoccales archaeon]